MNKTFSVIKTNIGAEIQDTSSAFATLLGRFINRRYFQILRAANISKTNPDYSFNTVASQANYALPDDFGKELFVVEASTGIKLDKLGIDEMFRLFGDTVGDTGTPSAYSIYEDCVKAQPTATSVLALVSSSTSDTTQTVLIRGISGGSETYETVSLSGTTPVNTVNSYTQIKGISKSAATAGYVTVTSNSAAVTNAVIARELLAVRYKLIKFHYVPASVVVIKIPYIINPLPLSQDGDYPIIDCSDLLELGAVADAWRYKRQFNKAAAYEVMFNQELQALIFNEENQPNQIHQFLPNTFDRDGLY